MGSDDFTTGFRSNTRVLPFTFESSLTAARIRRHRSGSDDVGTQETASCAVLLFSIRTVFASTVKSGFPSRRTEYTMGASAGFVSSMFLTTFCPSSAGKSMTVRGTSCGRWLYRNRQNNSRSLGLAPASSSAVTSSYDSCTYLNMSSTTSWFATIASRVSGTNFISRENCERLGQWLTKSPYSTVPSRKSSSKSHTRDAPGKALPRWCVIHFRMMLSATEKTLDPTMDVSVAESTARSPQLGTVLNCFGVTRLRTKMRIVCVSTARHADAFTSRNLSRSS